MSGEYAHDGLQISPMLDGRWKERIEPLAVTLTPRFVQNQVVVTLAIGREYFEGDGTTLRQPARVGPECADPDPRAAITEAVEDAMRALKAGGGPSA